MNRPFESRMAEIDAELRNFGEEMRLFGTALKAIERCTVDALIKFDALQDRRQLLLADFARLRADVRRTQ